MKVTYIVFYNILGKTYDANNPCQIDTIQCADLLNSEKQYRDLKLVMIEQYKIPADIRIAGYMEKDIYDMVFKRKADIEKLAREIYPAVVNDFLTTSDAHRHIDSVAPTCFKLANLFFDYADTSARSAV